VVSGVHDGIFLFPLFFFFFLSSFPPPLFPLRTRSVVPVGVFINAAYHETELECLHEP